MLGLLEGNSYENPVTDACDLCCNFTDADDGSKSAVPNSQQGLTTPTYDLATETTFQGTVEEVKDRQCPMSGGVGTHLILRFGDGKTIEVHLATAKFVKTMEFVFKQGDQVQVRGTKVQFEGKETIFAREITRGNETIMFRDKTGKPIW